MDHADTTSPDIRHDWRLNEGMALCFLAGAGPVFRGNQLLITPNPSFDTDMAMLGGLGFEGQAMPRGPAEAPPPTADGVRP